MWKLPLLKVSSSIDSSRKVSQASPKSFVKALIDTELVAVFQDSRKKAILPQGAEPKILTHLNQSGIFVADLASVEFLRWMRKEDPRNLLFFGLGSLETATVEKARSVGGVVWSKLKASKSHGACLDFENFLKATQKDGTEALSLLKGFLEGLVLAAYSFDKYQSKKSEAHAFNQYSGPETIVIVCKDPHWTSHIQIEVKKITHMMQAVQLTRDWSNEPSNIGTPHFFAQEAKKWAKKYGLQCKILTPTEIAREKMGLFLGVGQGASRENRFLVLEYIPKKLKKYKTIAWVGKGVTFDSGGISIKPSLRMEDMKHDMTGAATVMGALVLAAAWEAPNRILAYLPFTENMPDGNAIQPGNILTSRSGKTVEIINTDAEGRLILADALDYAQDIHPDVVIDVATLTGAVGIALGKHCSAILGNDPTLIQSIRQAGEYNGERIWELPLYDEYFDDLKSECADMKNSANDSLGGTIRGAIFLKQFIRTDIKWAHLDIAATAYQVTHLTYYPKKGASGAYVRTLAQFACDFS